MEKPPEKGLQSIPEGHRPFPLKEKMGIEESLIDLTALEEFQTYARRATDSAKKRQSNSLISRLTWLRDGKQRIPKSSDSSQESS